MEITIRNLVKELLENKYLIVSYKELDNGGFDLSVRINEKLVKTNESCKESESFIERYKNDRT